MSDVDSRIREALRGAADAYQPEQPVSLDGVHHRARSLRGRVLITTLIVALLVASGSFLITLTTSSTKPGSFVGPTANDPRTNLVKAQAEIHRLLQLVDLPRGTVKLTASPTPELGRGSPERLTGNFIDAAAWWRSPLSLKQTMAWIQTHRPRGLGTSDVGNYRSKTFLVQFLRFAAPPDTQAYRDAALYYSLETLPGGTTGLRVDGTAVWFKGGPIPVTKTGPRIRVTVAGGCPSTLRNYTDVSNEEDPALKRGFLPQDAPTAALRCIYKEQFGPVPALALDGSKLLGSGKAGELAGRIGELPLGSPGNVSTSCPLITSGTVVTTEIIVFSYRGRPDVDLWHSIFCEGSVDNGFITTVDVIGRFPI